MFGFVKAYQVQFLLPCEDPVNNIWRRIKRGVVHFEVPINTPDIHMVGYSQLAAWAKDATKPDLPTSLNNKTGLKSKKE